MGAGTVARSYFDRSPTKLHRQASSRQVLPLHQSLNMDQVLMATVHSAINKLKDDDDWVELVAWRLFDLSDPISLIQTPEGPNQLTVDHGESVTSPVERPMIWNASSAILAPPARPPTPPSTWVKAVCSRQNEEKRRTRLTSPDGMKTMLKVTPQDLCLAEPLLSSPSSIQSSPDIFADTPSPFSSPAPSPLFFFGDDFEIPLTAKSLSPIFTNRQRLPVPPPMVDLPQSSTPLGDGVGTHLCSSSTLLMMHFLKCDEVLSAGLTPPSTINLATPSFNQDTPTDILAAVVAEVGLNGSNSSGSSPAPPSRTPGASFTELDWQETELRNFFNKRAYLSAQEKAKLGRKLGLSVENIQRWFKNARRRRSREHERRMSLVHKEGRKFKLNSL